MNRQLTALFAALEALLVVGVGIGIPLVPLTLMWAVQYGLQIDWVTFWRASVDIWLLGHGTDIAFALDAAVAESSGLLAAADPFSLTIAPLAFAVVTLLLAVRAGRRIGETDHRHFGQAVATVVFAGLALLLTITVTVPAASPSLIQGLLLPTLVFVAGLAIGSALAHRDRRLLGREDAPGRLELGLDRVRDWSDERMPGIRPAVRPVVSGGVAAAFIVLAAGALAVALLLAFSYGEIITLYEASQAGALGGAALTLGQLALVPNLVIWGASWFVGPGFALGSGSAISPFGTTLGPVPAIPVLGALPTDVPFGLVGVLVPVLAGFASGMVVRRRLERAGVVDRRELAGVGAAMGLVAGVVLAVLAAVSSGSAGPGRLAEVGASWLLVGAWAALEVMIGALIALLLVGYSWGSVRGRSRQAAGAADVGGAAGLGGAGASAGQGVGAGAGQGEWPDAAIGRPLRADPSASTAEIPVVVVGKEQAQPDGGLRLEAEAEAADRASATTAEIPTVIAQPRASARPEASPRPDIDTDADDAAPAVAARAWWRQPGTGIAPRRPDDSR